MPRLQRRPFFLALSSLLALGVLGCEAPPAGGGNGEGQGDDDDSTEAEVGLIWTQVSAGYDLTCGIDETGAAHCWGAEEVVWPSDESYRWIAASKSGFGIAACGVTTGGEVHCWERGSGPVFPLEGTAFVQVDVDRYVCAVDEEGVISCNTANIEFYDGWTFDHVEVSSLTGDGFACGRIVGDKLNCAGAVAPGNTGSQFPVSLADTNDRDDVRRFSLYSNMLCFTQTNYPGPTGVRCLGLDSVDFRLSGEGFPDPPLYTQPAVGAQHLCGLHETGEVFCGGGQWFDYYGQSRPPEGRFVEIDAGESHTCGIKDDGQLVCWGLNDQGQCDVPPLAG